MLFTNAMAGRYAPELDYRGAIATAPPTQWRTTIAAVRPFAATSPAIPNVLLVLESIRATHPDAFDPGNYLAPAGAELFAQAQSTLCFRDLAERLAGRPATELYDVDNSEQERLTRLLEHDADIPIGRKRPPVYIAQGTADTVVYPPASKTTAEQLAAAGTPVTFRYYPGADHNGVLAAAQTDLLTWAAERFTGRGRR